MKKVMLAAASSGSGKTTITLGLLQLLMDRGFAVQPYKVGPDYVDTEYHTRITQRPSRNLDMFMVKEASRVQELFAKEACHSDICVIEGVMGLFDGLGVDKDYCSSAGVAKLLDCPVVLIVDGKSASTSVAAVVKGFLDFDPELDICGVIVNKVASQTHYELIKKAIETYTNTQVLGYLQRNPDIQLPSRQLGLVPDREIDNVMEKVKKIAASLAQTLDLDGLLQLLPEEEVHYQAKEYPQFADLTVAYAYDEAFHFYYPDNLELLQLHGVQLVTFSPMRDSELPEADLYYFGGGYPEEFALELSQNHSMIKSIQKKFGENACILAECGGLMYLGEYLVSFSGAKYEMAGIFEGGSRMTKRLQSFGYCTGIPVKNLLIGEIGQEIVGHEFHHSVFETLDPPVMEMHKLRDGKIAKRWQGGYQERNTFASYMHLHFYQEEDFVANLLKRVREGRGLDA